MDLPTNSPEEPNIPAAEIELDHESRILDLIKEMLHSKDFCAFSGFNTLTNFATFLFVPFVFIHFDHIGLSSFWIQIFMAVISIGAMVGSLFWANLAPTAGYKQILLICSILKGLLLCGYFFIDQTTSFFFLFFFFIADGFFSGGLITANFALLTAETPQKTRGLITAFFFSLIGIAGLLGSLCSGIFMDFFAHHNPLTIYGLLPFHCLMLISIVILLLSTIPLAFYRGRVEGTTWNTICMFFQGNPFLSFIRLTSLTGRGDLKDRLAFISHNRSPLFIEELIDATCDASATVRRAAASSLGEIKDTRATARLLTLLQNKDSGLSVQAACSLGALKDIAAVNALHDALESSSADLRAAAASSLAQIGDRTSLTLLKEHLFSEESSFVAAALSDAISHFKHTFLTF